MNEIKKQAVELKNEILNDITNDLTDLNSKMYLANILEIDDTVSLCVFLHHQKPRSNYEIYSFLTKVTDADWYVNKVFKHYGSYNPSLEDAVCEAILGYNLEMCESYREKIKVYQMLKCLNEQSTAHNVLKAIKQSINELTLNSDTAKLAEKYYEKFSIIAIEK